MTRIPRYCQMPESGTFHIILRSSNEQWLCREVGDFEFLYGRMWLYCLRYGLQVHHYCMMATHVHLLASADQTQNLAPLVKGLSLSYVHYYRKQYEQQGHLWHGRYRAKLIDSDEYFLQCARYIERNPVAAGLCAHPGAYLWSSYHSYVTAHQDRLVSPHPIWSMSGDVHRAFVNAEDSSDIVGV